MVPVWILDVIFVESVFPVSRHMTTTDDFILVNVRIHALHVVKLLVTNATWSHILEHIQVNAPLCVVPVGGGSVCAHIYQTIDGFIHRRLLSLVMCVGNRSNGRQT